MHNSVLVEEICKWIDPHPQGVYVDCTLGLGGTTRRILEIAGKNAVVIGLDRDCEAIALSKDTLKDYADSMVFCHGNFSHIEYFIKKAGFHEVDGIVFDLGVSSWQLDQPERGFSFMQDGPLDMRMDNTQRLTAEDLVNKISEQELADLIFQYGEERFSRRIARGVIRARALNPIKTTHVLVKIIEDSVPGAYRRGRLHPATRTFQALRIAVNQELDILTGALQSAVNVLKIGGRLCVVSFHSLEDRIVKHTFRAMTGKEHGMVSILTKKPLIPNEEEVRRNPRARSAKLRVVERLDCQKGALS
ncbi:MAG: 16S rRNA (cytosine(1402)-N(4))-methyltransferase RsmH [Nitrospirales bacterium]|nr:16S rRNA (cytosine(1402)-N(4))-methyltransferase RsmH [Nitrospirales bacterium]